MTEQTQLDTGTSAHLSDDGCHRYRLTRRWGKGELLGWCMLNPSTADASEDDPTIRRCIGFSRAWGYDGIVVVNLFSWRATDPRHVVANLADAATSLTDRVLLEVASECKTIVCAWGAKPWSQERGTEVARLLRYRCSNLVCLGRSTLSAAPLHPLYLPKTTQPEPYQP